MTVEDKLMDIDEASRYLYTIDNKVTLEQYEAISTLRQLINEGFVKEGKQISNQFIYDKIKRVLK